MLLSVDLGVRTGWALFDTDGRLCRLESRNFGSVSKMKSGIPTIVKAMPEIDVVVTEGGHRYAKLWFRCRPEWETELVSAEAWRPEFLKPREMRTGRLAKGRAIQLALELARADGCGALNHLNDDSAEAVLLGLWAVRQRGWR